MLTQGLFLLPYLFLFFVFLSLLHLLLFSQLLWRAAALDDDGPALLLAAEAASPRAFADPGLAYCKGLYHRLAADPHQALHFLNKARRDGEWGPAALGLMVTVYIEPFVAACFGLEAGEEDDDAGKGGKDGKGAAPGGGARGRGSEVIRPAATLLKHFCLGLSRQMHVNRQIPPLSLSRAAAHSKGNKARPLF